MFLTLSSSGLAPGNFSNDNLSSGDDFSRTRGNTRIDLVETKRMPGSSFHCNLKGASQRAALPRETFPEASLATISAPPPATTFSSLKGSPATVVDLLRVAFLKVKWSMVGPLAPAANFPYPGCQNFGSWARPSTGSCLVCFLACSSLAFP